MKSMLFIILRVVDYHSICCKNSQEPSVLFKFLSIRRDKLINISASQALNYRILFHKT